MGFEWFLLFIPIVLSIGALLIFKHAMTWFETLIPIAVGVIIIMSMKFFMVKSLSKDTEYFSGYVVKATYYEPWDEYVHSTCTRTYQCGDTTCTEAYDCSYVDYHSAYWEVRLNTGKRIYVSETYWKSLALKFGNKTFVDMKRNYHYNDGDAYVTRFPGTFELLEIYDWSGTYSNKPQTNETVFHFEDLDPDEMEGVTEYPEIKNWTQEVCIGCTREENELLRKINGIHGGPNQIHVFIIQTEGSTIELAETQKRHWKNGNKNELVIVTDKDSKWAKTFSWSDDKRLEAQCNALFIDGDLSMSQKIMRLHKMIPNLWVRKEFKDFNYIQVQLKMSQLYWIGGVLFFVSLGLLIYGVMNDIYQEDHPNYNRWGSYNRKPFYRSNYGRF